MSVEQLGNACTMYHICLSIFAFKCRADCMCTSHKSSGGSWQPRPWQFSLGGTRNRQPVKVAAFVTGSQRQVWQVSNLTMPHHTSPYLTIPHHTSPCLTMPHHASLRMVATSHGIIKCHKIFEDFFCNVWSLSLCWNPLPWLCSGPRSCPWDNGWPKWCQSLHWRKCRHSNAWGQGEALLRGAYSLVHVYLLLSFIDVCYIQYAN